MMETSGGCQPKVLQALEADAVAHYWYSLWTSLILDKEMFP